MLPKLSNRSRNLMLAGAAGLAGLASVIIIVSMLLLGLWVDAQRGGGRVFTVLGILIGVPLSLAVMLFISISAVQRIIPQPKGQGTPAETEQQKEEKV